MSYTPKESYEIFRIANVNVIDSSPITYEQAIDIARVLGITGSELNVMFNRLSDKTCPLDVWLINIEPLRSMPLASYARYIAQSNMENAVRNQDKIKIEQANRELKAASALERGDISAAFRSLNYFQDR